MVKPPINKLYVIKRDGRQEEVHLDKITSRIQKLCYKLNMDYIDPLSITLQVINGLYPGVTTVELDTLAAEKAAMMTTNHPDYAILAARIEVSNLHKETKKQFSDVVSSLYNAPPNKITGKATPLISKKHYELVMKNADRLNSCIIYDRDFSYNYFAFKLLERSYLIKIDGKVVERPQHMLMRVAVGIHNEDIDAAIETYNLLSEKFFSFSSTVLFNAAKPNAQLSSSYTLMMPDDSIEGIFTCISYCAFIAKAGGSLGVNIQNIRAKNTYIAGTNGVSNGLVPMLRVFNNTACFIDLGANKRPGAVAIYLEPWHADVLDVLNLKKPSGKEEVRARDLSYALWVPDLFMRRVEANAVWSLMCPHQCPGLADAYGKDFEELYEKYEAAGKYKEQIPAQDLWKAIIVSQMETGMPHILYKDTVNKKSNQQNLGTIRGSGLCSEVLQFTSPEETAACCMAAIAVNMFVDSDRKSFDFNKLKQITKVVAKNLDKVIDVNDYAVAEAEVSSKRHRAIGIGVQGLADVFILMKMPYDSAEAALLNKQIFETIYYGALEASCEVAEKDGPYSSYEGSPISRGVLQYDLWEVIPTNLWDWSELKAKIAKSGVRNSLLITMMPTNNTAKILGNNKSIEPYVSNVFTRRVTCGEFQVINEHLMRDLTDLGLWDNDIKEQIIAGGGSIQHIPNIPNDLKLIYRTVWEISQKSIINMSVDRGAFIDQSQSLNIHLDNANYGVISSMHFYGWRKGLKTGLFYLKSRVGRSVRNLTGGAKAVAKLEEKVDEVKNEDKEDEEEEDNMAALVCSLQNPEACDMCGA